MNIWLIVGKARGASVMHLLHEDLKKYILHYSDVHDKEVSKMITSGLVPSEADAKRLLAFIDTLFEHSTQDMEDEKVILGELASNYDAEKAGLAIFRLLKDNKFELLIDNWKC